jgi:flagellar basal body-associated protein FliL
VLLFSLLSSLLFLALLLPPPTMSNTSTSSLFSIPTYDPDLFDSIHAKPTYLSRQENESSIREICTVAVIITAVHLFLLLVVKMIQSSNTKSTSKNDTNTKKEENISKAAWKASYQLTNLFVNLSLGIMGIHYELSRLLHSHHSSSSSYNTNDDDDSINKITGYTPLRYFATIQIGYQLWALPIGILFVNEQSSMIVHHIAVICVASTSTFLTCGFRYFIPFFYGVIEISSVPLSIMNAFRNRVDWMEMYPSLYGRIRLLFGITFLIVRVLLWTPFYWEFIVLAVMLWRGSVGSTKVILGVFIVASIVLTLLQYFWAGKIVSAMVKSKKKKGGKKVD